MVQKQNKKPKEVLALNIDAAGEGETAQRSKALVVVVEDIWV